jgi:hypothetical protein
MDDDDDTRVIEFITELITGEGHQADAGKDPT